MTVEKAEENGRTERQKRRPASGIVELLEKRRKVKGWSWDDLANESGVSRSSLAKIRHSTTAVPSLVTLEKLANALSMPLRELIEACGYVLDDAVVTPQSKAAMLVQTVPSLAMIVDHLSELTADDREALRTMIEGFTLLRRREREEKMAEEQQRRKK